MSRTYGGASEVRVRRSERDEWRDVEASPSASAESELGVRRASGSNASTPKSAASNASSPFPPFVPPPCGRRGTASVAIARWWFACRFPRAPKPVRARRRRRRARDSSSPAPGAPDGQSSYTSPRGRTRTTSRSDWSRDPSARSPCAWHVPWRVQTSANRSGLGEPEAYPSRIRADARRVARRVSAARARRAGRGRHALLVRRHRVHASPTPTFASSRCRAARRKPPRRRRLGRFHAAALVAGGNRRRATDAHPARPGRPQFPRHARVGAAVGHHARRASSRARRRRDRGSRARTRRRRRRRRGEVGDGRRRRKPRRGSDDGHHRRRLREDGAVHLSAHGVLARDDHRRAATARRRASRVRRSRRSRRGYSTTRPVAHGVGAARDGGVVPRAAAGRGFRRFIGFNTGMGGGGGELARGWAADLVRALSRPNTPAAFTAANDYADLRGELAAFRALGARFAVEPSANPFRAYTHTVGEGDGPAGLRERPSDAAEGERWSCANARSGTSCGASRTDEVPPRGSRTHSCARWLRGRRNARRGRRGTRSECVDERVRGDGETRARGRKRSRVWKSLRFPDGRRRDARARGDGRGVARFSRGGSR